MQLPSQDKVTRKAKKSEPAESWEEEAEASSNDVAEEGVGVATPIRPGISDLPGAPPPTPASPSQARTGNVEYQSFQPLYYSASFDPTACTSSPAPSPKGKERRPDKTTSVAARLIATGIGQKAPKRTQEQREYDQAMKIQEKARRDQAKEAEERKKREKEQAQKDIWGD